MALASVVCHQPGCSTGGVGGCSRLPVCGVSVLCAAHRSGARVTLFESEATCGGHTLTDSTSPFSIDVGFQVCGRARAGRHACMTKSTPASSTALRAGLQPHHIPALHRLPRGVCVLVDGGVALLAHAAGLGCKSPSFTANNNNNHKHNNSHNNHNHIN